MKLFSKFLKKPKPRVFLGSLSIIQKKDFEEAIAWGLLQRVDIEGELKGRLENLISLPSRHSQDQLHKEDLGLDIAINNYNSGGFAPLLDMGVLATPWCCRPKLEIAFRLYRLDDDKTVKVLYEKETMAWREYFSRTNSLNALFRYKPLFNTDDMEILFCKACLRALSKLNLHD